MSHNESVEPTERVKKMVGNSIKYQNKGHRGALDQGGPHVPDAMMAVKKRGRKRG